MRTFSIVTAIFTALVLLIVGYMVATSSLGVTVTSITSEPASNQSEAFETAASWAAENDNANVTKFTSDAPGDISKYSMVYVSVELSNWDLLPAEWVQLNVQPLSGDVLQIRQDANSARALGKTTFQAVIIAPNETANSARQVEVEYYVFGKKHTVKSAAAQQ